MVPNQPICLQDPYHGSRMPAKRWQCRKNKRNPILTFESQFSLRCSNSAYQNSRTRFTTSSEEVSQDIATRCPKQRVFDEKGVQKNLRPEERVSNGEGVPQTVERVHSRQGVQWKETTCNGEGTSRAPDMASIGACHTQTCKPGCASPRTVQREHVHEKLRAAAQPGSATCGLLLPDLTTTLRPFMQADIRSKSLCSPTVAPCELNMHAEYVTCTHVACALKPMYASTRALQISTCKTLNSKCLDAVPKLGKGIAASSLQSVD